MAAPKKPNPGPAAKKRREQGDATAARRLRAAGWTVTPPPEPEDTADTVGSLRATLATAEAGSWDGWKKDEA